MLHNYLIQVKFKGVKNLLCAHGRARQTQHLFSWRRISQSEIRNSAAAESEGGQKFLPPQPPSFLPARAFSLAREARRQFRSKKVRISSNKRTKIRTQMRPYFCGRGGSRTHTALRPYDFESYAYTSSATHPFIL